MPPPPRHETKALTRQAILHAGRDIFARQGYEQTTIRQIAQAAGVGVGSVHLHFDNKLNLLAAVLLEGLEPRIAEGINAAQAPLPLAEQLQRLFRPLFVFYAEQPELSRVLLKEGLFLQGGWKERFDRQIQAFLEEVGKVLLQGQQTRQWRSDIPIEGATQTLFALYLATLIWALREGGELTRFETLFATLLLPWIAAHRRP